MPETPLLQSPLAPGLALLFDMDGVLVDSNPVHREAWIQFNRRYGIETSPAMLQRMYGKRNDQIIRDYFGEDLSDEEVAARGAAKEEMYREMIASRIEEILVPGLRSFLDRYRAAPMAVASNAEPKNVDFVLEKAGLKRYFCAVVDGHQVSQPKPHPEVFLRAAALLGTPPANCVVFEDSHAGVAAANAAGMKVIGLDTTEVNLPGTHLTVHNFLSECLTSWLETQRRVV